MKIGAQLIGDTACRFVVWAPLKDKVDLKIISPSERIIPMKKIEHGYWIAEVDGVKQGDQYVYRLNDEIERPDPASCAQPGGVHQLSMVIDHRNFPWTDQSWKNVPLEMMIIYELHIGTFSRDGTFESVIPRLDQLKELGINAIELMPVAQFPGERNWGYDGVYPFAVHQSYGGHVGLKKLVNACHQSGIAVILDVVYNHLGPEGNYLRDFAPYFTGKYETPWGDAVNFDGPHSDGVRNFFISNAMYWFEYYHMDALRLDAVHGIFDFSASHFLKELADNISEFSNEQARKVFLIAESDLNDARVISSVTNGGYAIDAQWNDDFHHCVHTLLTGEEDGYYADFGDIEHLKKALLEGFVYSGQHSEFRHRRHGNSSVDIPAHQFVVCVQNHDQVGNRMLGERLSSLVEFNALKLAAGILLLSPYIPLIFMGEEYGETSPFLYFVSHENEELIRSVREGRKAEFQFFDWQGSPPDPQSEAVFWRSKLKWETRSKDMHGSLLNFYKELIQLRKTIPALKNLSKKHLEIVTLREENVLMMWRWVGGNSTFSIFNFDHIGVEIPVKLPGDEWNRIFDSEVQKWNGAGAITPQAINGKQAINLHPYSFALYQKEGR